MINALVPDEEFDKWSAWAPAQADRIDLAIGGTFAKSMHYEEDR
jgi:hypothetical protein